MQVLSPARSIDWSPPRYCLGGFALPAFNLVMLLVFAVSLFCSATLLFVVQPMVGKMILPLLGGSPEVWNTCMVSYQALLLAGYLYAHLTTKWFGVRKQAMIHLGVLLLPALFLPITINSNLVQSTGEVNPIWTVLHLLFVAAAVPFFVISTSAPLLQKWFASTDHPAARDPYFLYGASNLGSMLALLGYPYFIEPLLQLTTQRYLWTVGYVLFFLATIACAVLLWKAPPARQEEEAKSDTGEESEASESGSDSIQPDLKARNKGRKRSKKPGITASPTPTSEEQPDSLDRSQPVTLKRRLRWIALSAIPSSLMMGVTTYVTTDIAAIPLLWVAPLALYLLSFILVFSRLPKLVHLGMILAMPLLILLIVFMKQSELKPEVVVYNVALHMASLFVVAMVMHGELARDRPSTGYLTEYFLLMSLGGVIGGFFNALVAPLIFNSLAEYDLAMVAACLLLPPLTEEKPAPWTRIADLVLIGLFIVVGTLLIYLRIRDDDLPFGRLSDSGRWIGSAIGVLIVLVVGGWVIWQERKERSLAVIDIVLPLTLGLLVVGLYWGLYSSAVLPSLVKFAANWEIGPRRLLLILTFGLPIVLCYTFVERTVRFGFGLAMLLIVSTFCNIFENDHILEKRSFFGVLTVERQYIKFPDSDRKILFHRLLHGTTLHGMQYFPDPDDSQEMQDAIRRRQGVPLTYYAESGPVGQVMQAYSKDNSALALLAGPLAGYTAQPGVHPHVAVIGLGTGTMACYARPGQKFTFYDIDPLVRDIAFNPKFFTYVDDAKNRGAQIDLLLNDARLAIERQVRNKPSEEEKYGVMVIDAFSSDAIPVHLITQEALGFYLGMLKQDGVLAFHISNRYLDLRPVLANLAAAHDPPLVAYYQNDRAEEYVGKSASTWVVIARDEKALSNLMTLNRWRLERQQAFEHLLPLLGVPDHANGFNTLILAHLGLAQHRMVQAPWIPVRTAKKVGIWTDDYSNLLGVFGDPYAGEK